MTTLVLVGCQDESVEQPTEPAIRPVKVFEVVESTQEKVSLYPASITAANTSDLSFQVAGKITEFDLNESDPVKEGQVIAKLDDSDYRNQFNALKAQYDNAVTEYQRSENLLAQDAIAKNVVEQRKSQMDVLKAQLDVAAKSLADTVLTAPYSGNVSKVAIEKFQNVQPLQTIVTIINEGSLEANVNIPASILSQSPGDDIVSAEVSFESIPGLSIPATFKEIELTADASTQTYPVKFQFEAPTESLVLPGMSGNLKVVSKSKTESTNISIQIPINTIQSSAGQQFVWVVDKESMTVKKRNIEVLPAVGKLVPVTSGLEKGEFIAAAGGAYLAEGMKIKIWENQ